MQLERIDVITRDDYRDAQEPIAFTWRGTRHEIEQVQDRWLEGRIDSTRMPLRYFRVITKTGRHYLIRYHELFCAWAICVKELSQD